MNDRRAAAQRAPAAGWGTDATAARTASVLALLLVLGCVLLPGVSAWAAPASLPADVPNIYDPEVQAGFTPVMVANLRDNPDFPMVLLVNTTGNGPEALLLGLDAHNGTNTWSLTGDPIILIVAFSGETVQQLYVDSGFAGQGTPSGTYARVDGANGSALPELLDAVSLAAAQTFI